METSYIDILVNNRDTSLSFCREVSCFLTKNHGLLQLTTDDNYTSVNLDFFKIWNIIQNNIKDDVAVIIHTHPPNCVNMSSTDKNMVYGWCQALGIVINFIIVCEDCITCWRCSKSESNTVNMEKIWQVNWDVYDFRHMNYLMIFSEILYGLSKTNNTIKIEDEIKKDINQHMECLLWEN